MQSTLFQIGKNTQNQGADYRFEMNLSVCECELILRVGCMSQIKIKPKYSAHISRIIHD
jgi:hypothetical protein